MKVEIDTTLAAGFVILALLTVLYVDQFVKTDVMSLLRTECCSRLGPPASPPVCLGASTP